MMDGWCSQSPRLAAWLQPIGESEARWEPMGERHSRPGGQPGWERRIIPCWWLMGKERRGSAVGLGRVVLPLSPLSPRRSAGSWGRRRGAGSGAYSRSCPGKGRAARREGKVRSGAAEGRLRGMARGPTAGGGGMGGKSAGRGGAGPAGGAPCEGRRRRRWGRGERWGLRAVRVTCGC